MNDEFAKCAVCGAGVTIHCASEAEMQMAPLADRYMLTCSEGCCNGDWTGRNLEHMREEWNETQRVLLVNESAHSRDAG